MIAMIANIIFSEYIFITIKSKLMYFNFIHARKLIISLSYNHSI